MRVLSRNLNLPLCQNDGQKLVTHCSARSSASNNQLDYILTNLPWHQTYSDDHLWHASDHRPLITHMIVSQVI